MRTHPQSTLALFGATLATVSIAASSSSAATFTIGHTVAPSIAPSIAPLYESVDRFTTTIPTRTDTVDETDIYYPVLPNSTAERLPTTLLLQGALVDKADYANFASIVASYGFVVIVPNRERTVIGPQGTITGLLAEQQQVYDVLTYARSIRHDPTSPIARLIDPDTLVLLGHSFGGAVGLSAIQGSCIPPLCFGDFIRPPELVAGAFYGTTFRDPQSFETILPISNDEIPIALVAGDRDGVAFLPAVQETYQQIQDPPKALVTVLGANHYGITNEDNVVRDPIRPTLEQAIATETIARWSALFLRATALNDAAAFEYVFNAGATLDPNVRVISETKDEPMPVSEPTTLLGLFIVGGLGTLWKKVKA